MKNKGCNEEQRIKWEVNKQIRRLKSKIAIPAVACLGLRRRTAVAR